MNFYDEAIEAKHSLQQGLIRRNQNLHEFFKRDTVHIADTNRTVLRTLLARDISAVEEADPYFWEPRLTQMVLASGQQLPDTVTFDASWVRGNAGYWWFGRLSPLIGVSAEGGRKYVGALLWNLNPNGSLSIQTYLVDGMMHHSLGALTWNEGETITEALVRTEETKDKIPHVPDIELRRIALELAAEHAKLASEVVDLDREILTKHESIKIEAKQAGEADDFDTSKYQQALIADLARVKQDEERFKEFSAEQQARLIEWSTASKNAIVTFACGSLWLNQKIITVTQAPLTRAAERRLTRSHIDKKCLVVELRSKQYSSAPSDNHSSVDWAYQWAVRGHWRDQPTKDGSKLVWIHPYLKGPEDKPIREDVARVFAVRR